MRKWFLFGAIVFASFSSGFAQGQQTPSSTDWNQWQNNKKVAFVEGFIAGGQWVAENSMLPESFFPNEAVRSRAQQVWDRSNEQFKKALSGQAKLSPEYTAGDLMLYAMFDGYKKNPLYERVIIKVPAKSIVSYLDHLYADSANSKVPISGAIYLANKSVVWASKEDIQILLPYLRGEKPIPPGWLIPVEDKSGKRRVVEFP